MHFDDLIHSSTKPDRSFRVIGIDLGTTNSTVAEFTWHPDKDPILRCLEIDQETLGQGRATHVLIPSMVALVGDKVFIGEGAKRLRSQTDKYKLEHLKNIFWECKNDMGLTRTYHKAPEGYRHAKEIAEKVLGFLTESALNEGDVPVLRTVVTVPASFQTAQRQDTLDASMLAGINIAGGDLLDEPVAAFLDYLYTQGVKTVVPETGSSNVVVFDFGGGTCDVAVFRISRTTQMGIQIAPLAVSRYCRLGGGDIDKAILHEVLLPQLIAQNGIDERELGYVEKSKHIEPAFLGLAEALKVGLCKIVATRREFPDASANPEEIVKTQPGVHSCTLPNGKSLSLTSPTLRLKDFDKLLEPFLDQDFLFTRESEYRMTASIFGPLTDSLQRAGLDRNGIDCCLMVGGSSLIPQVQDAVDRFFTNARLLYFPDSERTQTAIARGAACQALSLALTGSGIVNSVVPDSISIQTQSGPVILVQKGQMLPFPGGDDWAEIKGLAVPESRTDEELPIRVDLMSSDDRVLGSCTGRIRPPVKKGDPLVLRYRLDENQVLRFKLLMQGREESVVDESLESPLTNTVNPNETREQIDKIEEGLRTQVITGTAAQQSVLKLVDLYSDLAYYEKAFGMLQAVIAQRGPNNFLLNKLGILCNDMGDHERAEKFYLEAASMGRDSTPLFNLALQKKNQGQHEQALRVIDKALEMGKEGPYLVLRALVLKMLKREDEKSEALSEALDLFEPVALLNEWELGWFLTAAKLLEREDLKREASAEMGKRKLTNTKIAEGYLPELHN